MTKKLAIVLLLLVASAMTFIALRWLRPSRVLPRVHGEELRFTLRGRSPDDEFGGVVEILPDGNGDGRPDLAVGAPYDDAAGRDAGRVALFDHEGNLLVDLLGRRAGECLGSEIRRLADVDGDGVDDFAVGASGQAGQFAGRVVVYSGRDRRELWSVEGRKAAGRFGHAIASLNDVNGDGTPDLAVGAPGNNGREVNGAVRALSGRNGATLWEVSEEKSKRFGYALKAVEDLDGDGVGDLAVASRWAPLRILSASDGKELDFGFDVTAHDLDVLLPAPEAPEHLLVGTFDQDRPGGVQLLRLASREKPYDFSPAGLVSFGHTVSRVGDVNGDGYMDFAAAAPDADVGGLPRVGLIEIHSGKPFEHGLLGLYRGEREGDNLGYALCGGDLDGDGYAEIVLGTTVDDGTPGHLRVISLRRKIPLVNGEFREFVAPPDMGPEE